MADLKKLFEPIRIGSLTLKNRIVMAPLHCSLASVDGEVTKTACDYFNVRAQGGAAMLNIGVVLVHPHGRTVANQFSAHDDRFIPGLHRLARGIKENGALSCAQIHHAGRYGLVGVPVAPSDVPAPGLTGEWYEPRALTTKETEEIVDFFGDAARRIKSAGFDMVELHGATGYLITQFYSPRTNKRTDKYGGSFENRIRFPLEIIENVQKKCGSNYPVGIRIIGDEWLPDGFHLDEAVPFAKRLEEAGVAYLSVTAGTYESFALDDGYFAMAAPKGKTVKYGAEIKKHVGVPIFINGRIADPVWMDQLLREGKGDVIALGRPLISDPGLPKKAQEGRLDDIRKCISCCYCLDSMIRNWPIQCFQNAEVAREAEYRLEPAEKSKKVLVVGGGPAGLEAARVTALRGHDVTLLEKQGVLGGQLLLAARPTGKEEYKTVTVDWLITQCKKAGVKIRLNTVADSHVIGKFKPHVLVLATGARPLVYTAPGATGKSVITYEDAFEYKGKWKQRRVVVVGGGDIGSEVAEFLACKGAIVTIVEMLSELAPDMEFQNRVLLLTRLKELGVATMTNHLLEEIRGDEAIVRNLQNFERQSLKADRIVLAIGVVPNDDVDKCLRKKVRDQVEEVYNIGDCVEPGKAVHAIHKASFIARQI